MTVTYKEIRERQAQLEATRDERIEQVVSEAVALVDAYQDSLQLESPTWRDIQGALQPYVIAGAMYGTAFTKTSLSGIELDADYGLQFTIATVVDDSPRGGDTALVDIYLFVEDGVAFAAVSGSERHFPISGGEHLAICDEIKDRVLMSILDPGLEKRRYL